MMHNMIIELIKKMNNFKKQIETNFCRIIMRIELKRIFDKVKMICNNFSYNFSLNSFLAAMIDNQLK